MSSIQQYGLAIHTASSDLGLAISNFLGDDRAQVWAGLGQTTSSHLHLYLAEFIQPQTWEDLAFIAVAKGPGGFTGTRLGIVTARTLAQQLDIPLFAISTLAAVAWEAGLAVSPAAIRPLQEHLDIAVQMMAHRGDVYGAIYRMQVEQREGKAIGSQLIPVVADAVMSPEQWRQTLSDWQHPHLIQVEGGLGATVTSLLELAYVDWQKEMRPHWSEALPFYGQSPV